MLKEIVKSTLRDVKLYFLLHTTCCIWFTKKVAHRVLISHYMHL